MVLKVQAVQYLQDGHLLHHHPISDLLVIPEFTTLITCNYAIKPFKIKQGNLKVLLITRALLLVQTLSVI